jgi:hypothetical protein
MTAQLAKFQTLWTSTSGAFRRWLTKTTKTAGQDETNIPQLSQGGRKHELHEMVDKVSPSSCPLTALSMLLSPLAEAQPVHDEKQAKKPRSRVSANQAEFDGTSASTETRR